jgi:hypothetical protein
LVIIIGQRIESQIECVHVPHLPVVNPAWRRHPAVSDELIEFAGGNSDVDRCLDARKPAARNGPNG